MKGQCQASVAHVQIMCGAGVFSKKYYCNDWRRFAIQCGQKSKFALNQAQAPMPDHCTLSLKACFGQGLCSRTQGLWSQTFSFATVRQEMKEVSREIFWLLVMQISLYHKID